MKMDVEIKLSVEQKSGLTKILKISPADLEIKFALYAAAAAKEYAEMFLGEKNFTRGSDIREYRLFLLIETVFDGAIPGDQQVASLFHVTLSQSKALIRSVMARYQHLLTDVVNESLRKILEKPTEIKDEDRFLVTINSTSLVAELNKILTALDASQDLVIKEPGKAAQYSIRRAAFEDLKKSLPAKKGTK